MNKWTILLMIMLMMMLMLLLLMMMMIIIIIIVIIYYYDTMICMNNSGCLSKSTMNLNKHLQINTKAQKLLRFVLLMTCYDLIMDFGWGSMDGRWARPIQTATTNGLLRRHPHKKGILFPSPGD